MNDDKIKLGVLWKSVSRDGNRKYLSGRVQEDGIDDAFALLRQGGRFLILSNNKRPEKRDPDCILYVVPDRAAADAPAPQSPPQPAARQAGRRG